MQCMSSLRLWITPLTALPLCRTIKVVMSQHSAPAKRKQFAYHQQVLDFVRIEVNGDVPKGLESSERRFEIRSHPP
jgi:hypothetical protein